MRRSSRSRFMPDAFVFPGGAVDAEDGSAAFAQLVRGETLPRRALVVAALRELFEEAGILLACTANGEAAATDAPFLSDARAQIVDGGTRFADMLTARNLVLDARDVVYYSNWITPASEPIRFDAHFYLASAPHGQSAAADAAEVHDGIWIAPGDALAQAEAGSLAIPFPTRKHLERLAAFTNEADALAGARGRSVVPLEPTVLSDGSIAIGNEAW